MTCLLAANMACSNSEESSVEQPVCSCAEVCFDNLSRGLVCFIIPICNRNITCLVRNLFPGFIPAFLQRYPWLYNIESRFTQMQEERVKVLVSVRTVQKLHFAFFARVYAFPGSGSTRVRFLSKFCLTLKSTINIDMAKKSKQR